MQISQISDNYPIRYILFMNSYHSPCYLLFFYDDISSPENMIAQVFSGVNV